MKDGLLVLFTLAVGLGASMLTGCRSPAAIDIQVIPGFNKPVPVLKQHDVVTWHDATGAKMQVKFDPYSPCETTDGNPTDTCHIKVSKGMFPYACDACDDPVVPVGS